MIATSTLLVNRQSPDPTATLSLRNQYAAAMRGRFNRFRQEMIRYLVGQWANVRAAGDLAFMAWTNTQIDLIILGIRERQGDLVIHHEEWQRSFVAPAFMRGLAFADRMLTQIGITPTPLTLLGVRPYQAEIDVILTQSFEQLRGVTAEMSRQIQAELIRGIAEGLGSEEIGRRLGDRVDRIGRTRGEIIARTETIRAFAEATLTRYERHGVSQVGALVEWRTAGDTGVCAICHEFSGQVFTIAEARGLLPAHPRCRCCWIPSIGQRINPLAVQLARISRPLDYEAGWWYEMRIAAGRVK